MTITRLRTELVEMPFEGPVASGHGQFRSAGCVLIFLECGDGPVGEGLVFTLNGQYLHVLAQLITEMAPLVVGLDPDLSGSFALRAAASLRPFGAEGFSAMACAGIETALLDLRAKRVGLPVHRLLGACRMRIPAYHSGDLWAGLSLDELQASAQRHLDRGFRAMKMRLHGNPAIDVPRLRALREVVGPEVGLLADANQRMTVPQAIRLGRALEEFGLLWLEEPVAATDHAGEAAVAAALDTPIASGESVYTSRGVLAMLEAGAADLVMPDLQRMGGPGEFLKAATLAEARSVPMSNHLFSEMSLGLLCAIPNATILEYMPWVSGIYAEAIELDAQGQAMMPERPGWGFSFDPDKRRHYAIAR